MMLTSRCDESRLDENIWVHHSGTEDDVHMQLSAMDGLRLHLREHARESRDTPTLAAASATNLV